MTISNKFSSTIFLLFLFISSFYGMTIDKKLTRGSFSSQNALTSGNGDTVYDCSSSSPIKDICNLVDFASNYEITFAASKSALGDNLLTATLPNFDPKSIANSLLSSDLYNFADSLGLLSVSLLGPQIMVNLGATQAIRFEANIELFGSSNITIDLLAVKGGITSSAKTNALAMTAKLPVSLLTTVVKQAINFDISSVVEIFSGSFIALALTSSDIEFTQISEMKPEYLIFIDLGTTLKQGFLIQGYLHFNENKTVGAFITKYLGKDAAAYIQILISTSGVSGFAGVANFDFGNGVVLDAAGIFFAVNKTNALEMGIRGKITFPAGDTTLNLQASLVFTTIEVQLEFSLSGIWTKAFTLSRLSIGNLVLMGKMTYAGVPSGVQGGGEIAIGLDCYNSNSAFIGEGYCIKAQAYLGMDASQYLNNYFYLNTSSLDVDTFLRALLGSKTEQKIPVPKIIQNSLSFPRGIFMSFCFKPQSLSSLNMQSGFRAAGTIQIFNVWASLDMIVSYTDMRVYFNLTASAIDFKVLQFKATGSHSGPFLVIDIQLYPPKFSVKMDASLTILGMTNAVVVNIDSDSMYFSITGMILGGIFIGQLDVSASSSSLTSNSFSIKGSIKTNTALTSAIKKVSDGISNALQSASDDVKKANSALSNAQSDLNAKKAKTCYDIDKACAKAGSCKTSHTECTKYGSKTECTQTAQKCTGGFNTVCTSSSKTCLGKSKKWWSWICVAWGWVCNASKQVCKGYSTVCKASKTVVDYANCQVRNTICDAYNTIVDATCKAACLTASAAYDTAKAAVTTAQASVTATAASLGALAKAAEALASLTDVFKINNASFKLELNTSTQNGISGGFAVDLDVVLLGKSKSFSASFDFSNLEKTAQTILSKALELVKESFK